MISNFFYFLNKRTLSLEKSCPYEMENTMFPTIPICSTPLRTIEELNAMIEQQRADAREMLAEHTRRLEHHRAEEQRRQESEEDAEKRLYETLQKVGMKTFGEVFCSAHFPNDFIINPLELVSNPQSGVKTSLEHEFIALERELHLNFFRKFFHMMDAKLVARSLVKLKDYDIPAELLAMIVEDAEKKHQEGK